MPTRVLRFDLDARLAGRDPQVQVPVIEPPAVEVGPDLVGAGLQRALRHAIGKPGAFERRRAEGNRLAGVEMGAGVGFGAGQDRLDVKLFAPFVAELRLPVERMRADVCHVGRVWAGVPEEELTFGEWSVAIVCSIAPSLALRVSSSPNPDGESQDRLSPGDAGKLRIGMR